MSGFYVFYGSTEECLRHQTRDDALEQSIQRRQEKGCWRLAAGRWVAFLEVSHCFVQTRSHSSILNDWMWVTLIYIDLVDLADLSWFLLHTHILKSTVIWQTYTILYGSYPSAIEVTVDTCGTPHVSHQGRAWIGSTSGMNSTQPFWSPLVRFQSRVESWSPWVSP